MSTELYTPEFYDFDDGPTIGELVPDFADRMARLDQLRGSEEDLDRADRLNQPPARQKRMYIFGGRLGLGRAR